MKLASGQTILYSGNENEDAPNTWEQISPRIIEARFYGGAINISVTQGYAPKNDTEPDLKEKFYNALQGVLEKLPNRDLVILMGDYNAKVDRDNTGR